MSAETATVVSLVIAGFAAFVAFASYLRGGNHDAKVDAADQAEVNTKLDFMCNDLKDIKADNRRYATELFEVREIATHATERAEAAHKRLDRAGIDIQQQKGVEDG